MSLEHKFAARVAEAAYQTALDFFQPSAEWEIDELEAAPLDGEAAAQIWTRSAYLYAKIVYDPDKHDSGADLWASIGHEVAHLLLLEYMAAEECLDGLKTRMLIHAGECTVTRLTRLFSRERPYPGDGQFAEPSGGGA